ncbi:MAG: L-2-amino-thiazoline-4-carboxylic acid hydrolase [Acidobacteriota bacterium]
MREPADVLSRRRFLIVLISSLSSGRQKITARARVPHSGEEKLMSREMMKQISEKNFVAQFFDQYFMALERRLKDRFPQEAKAVVEVIRKRTEEIKSENKGWISDSPSVFNLNLTAMIVATHQVLSQRIAGEKGVLELVRYAFFEGQQHHRAKEFFLEAMAKSTDAFSELVATSKAKEAGQYGEAFVFERERDDERFYFLNVRKCFYYDFFRAQGLPQLTPIFCDWDNVWGDELKDGRYGVIFERPETIGYGGRVCRFQFTRVKRTKL